MEISSNNLNSQNTAEIEENERNVVDGVERSQEQPTLTDNPVEKNERPAAVADFLNEEDSDEDDFIVTIGEIKTGLLPFQKQHGNRTGGANGNIDLDANPTLKDGTPIYDLDLASLEDKPWRKPGADLTDYFNYGFNEETWNKYCEMQRKFRQEFGIDQAAINKAILSNIQLSGAAQLGLNAYSGGRQLVNLLGAQDTTNKQQQQKVQKIVVDLSKPPPQTYGSTGGIGENTNTLGNTIPLIRTVISESGITRQESSIDIFSSNTALHERGNTPTGSPSVKTPPPTIFSNTGSKINVIDFTKPPPNFDPAIPPPVPVANQAPTIQQTQQSTIIQQTNRVSVDLPPGMEEDGPPGVSDLAPAGVKMELPPSIPRMDFSQPPPINQFPFNPTQSSFTSTSSFGSGIHLSQHSTFSSSRPPPLFQPSFRHQYGGGFGNRFHDRYKGGRGTMMSRSDNRSSDSENDTMPSQRKRRRSRSKSRSPSSSSRRRKEEKRKDREHKDGKKKKDKDRKEKHKSSHRSPSAKKERSIKTERASSEREKEEKESSSSSHRRLSPKRKEKDVSSKTEGLIKIKIERKTPIE